MLPRDYQIAGVDWLEAHSKSILADEVGLGKSLTATLALSRHLPALVLAPDYLTGQWYDILCETLPHASICLPEGTRTSRILDLQEHADVRVASLEMLRTYPMPNTQTLIIDEAHRLRNPKAIQSEKAKKLVWNTERVHFLTGTPYYKGDEDIWHLLHCLDPHRFSSYWDFLRTWYTVNWNAPYTPKIYGISRHKRAEFDAMLSNYMLQRTYTDVGRQLPPLEEQVITFTMPTLLLKEYKALKKQWQLAGEPIESVGMVYYILRQLTMCHLKVDIIKDIIDSVPRTEPILIFTQYIESAHTIAARLKRGYKEETCSLVLTGDTPAIKRTELAYEQKRTGWPRIVIATMDSLQEGLNLEHIRHVIYAEETYVKGKHKQTLARARRDRGDVAQLTPQPPVICYFVRARKTIDERIPVIRNSRAKAGDRDLAHALTLD